jgi:hypothetical protein
MEDFLTIGSHDITGRVVLTNNFLMWLQLPILKKNWRALSLYYSLDTREMVERLITQSDKLVLKRQSQGKLINPDYDEVSKVFEVTFR